LCLAPQEIYVRVFQASGTTPRLGVMPESRHEIDGSFLFFKKGAEKLLAEFSQNQKTGTQQKEANGNKATPAENAGGGNAWKTGAPPGKEFFAGTWATAVAHEEGYDTYAINFSINGGCAIVWSSVRSGGTTTQTTTGYWSWDGEHFTLNAVFRDPSRQNVIAWKSGVGGVSGSSFNIGGSIKKGGGATRITFYRE
jgi:hypothetical protein